jgi:hypothetical protein
MPSSGWALPSLHWAWTKNKRKPKLKPMLGLTNQWSRKLSPVTTIDGGYNSLKGIYARQIHWF